MSTDTTPTGLSIDVDQSELADAHERSTADSLVETANRALQLYNRLDNPDEMLAHCDDVDVTEAEVDQSRM